MTYAEIERLVRRLMRVWVRRLLLTDWDINLILVRDGHPEDENDRRCGAETKAHWRYRKAKIWFYLGNLQAHTAK